LSEQITSDLVERSGSIPCQGLAQSEAVLVKITNKSRNIRIASVSIGGFLVYPRSSSVNQLYRPLSVSIKIFENANIQVVGYYEQKRRLQSGRRFHRTQSNTGKVSRKTRRAFFVFVTPGVGLLGKTPERIRSTA